MGNMEINNGIQGLDVQSASRHVGGHENGDAFIGKPHQCLISIFLFEIAVLCLGTETESGQHVRHFLSFPPGITKHQS